MIPIVVIIRDYAGPTVVRVDMINLSHIQRAEEGTKYSFLQNLSCRCFKFSKYKQIKAFSCSEKIVNEDC